jgi:hypothetical protein
MSGRTDDDQTAPEKDDEVEIEAEPPAETEADAEPVFPWAEKIDTDPVKQSSLFESEAAAEADLI